MCKGSTRLISTASMEQGCTALYVSHLLHLLQAFDNSNHYQADFLGMITK